MTHPVTPTTPMLSWVIPVYNGERYIRQAIESILRQPCQDYEILIIDDGSTDSTVSLVRPFLGARVHLLQKENGGVSSARNLGIQQARGRYIAFLDADDVVCRNAYTSDIHNLLSAETHDLISFDYYCADQDLVKGNRKHTSYTKRSDGGLALDVFKHCSSFLYWRSLFAGDGAPCFPEGIKIREDVTFQFLMNHRAERIRIIDRPWFLYRNNLYSVLHRNKGHEYIVLDVIPAWQWCRDHCADPLTGAECEQLLFAELAAYIRLSCMSGKPLAHIRKALDHPAVQDALSHYENLWSTSKREYEAFLAKPRRYWLNRRLYGIILSTAQRITRIPALRKLYFAIKYTEDLETLR